jgi:hypothetical protein
MSDLTIFQGSALANSDLFKSLQGTVDNLLGGSGGGLRRISIRGGRFREIVNGEQLSVNNSNRMNVVILNAAKIQRMYYKGSYDPNAESAGPHCWSTDTNAPSADVPDEQRMSSRCMDCQMNIKGSGQGDSRACRFSQRVAVALEGALDRVYQLQLPATSIFGEAKDGKMPMQAYARYLNAHKTPPIAVVTEMYFDENSEGPKLFFRPVRPLTEDELNKAAALLNHPDMDRALTLTVSKPKEEAEKVAPAKAAPAPATVANKKVAKEPKTDKVEEPKKVSSKKGDGVPNADPDLDAIVNAWDD